MRLACALLVLLAADAQAGRSHKRSHGSHHKHKPRATTPVQPPVEEPADPAATPTSTAAPPDTRGIPARAAPPPADTRGIPARTAPPPADTRGIPARTAPPPADTRGTPARTAAPPADARGIPARGGAGQTRGTGTAESRATPPAREASDSSDPGASEIDASLAQSAPRRRAPSALELCTVALDAGVGARDLSFDAGALPGQRNHSTPAVALMGFRVEVHPFARFARPFLSGLGVTGGFLHSLGSKSVVDGTAQEIDSTWLSWDIGLHDRVRLGKHPLSPWVGLGLSYGRLSYAFSSEGRLVGDLPSVDYRFVRPSLDLRFPFGPVQLALAGGYRGIVEAGYLAERFASEVRHGFDASAQLMVSLPRGFVAGVRGDYTHVLHPGAVDRFASGTLFAAWMPR
jgi:hypothetical protein